MENDTAEIINLGLTEGNKVEVTVSTEKILRISYDNLPANEQIVLTDDNWSDYIQIPPYMNNKHEQIFNSNSIRGLRQYSSYWDIFKNVDYLFIDDIPVK